MSVSPGHFPAFDMSPCPELSTQATCVIQPASSSESGYSAHGLMIQVRACPELSTQATFVKVATVLRYAGGHGMLEVMLEVMLEDSAAAALVHQVSHCGVGARQAS